MHTTVVRFCLIITCVILASCSPDKFLSGNDTLLSSVKLSSTSPNIDPSAYSLHVRQEPNSKWFNLLKVPLGLYSISSTDSTRKSSRFWRRIGEAPVIYSETQTANSRNSIALALKDKGYLQASVTSSVITDSLRHRTKVNYILNPGKPYIIDTITYLIDDPQIDSIISATQSQSYLQRGMLCDVSRLDNERNRITTLLRNNGYYKVVKNYISYRIDTLSGPDKVALTLLYEGKSIARDPANVYHKYKIRDVNVYINANQSATTHSKTHTDSKIQKFKSAKAQDLTPDSLVLQRQYCNITYRNANHPILRPQLINNSLYVRKDSTFSETDIAKTYNALYGLKANRFISIQLREADSLNLDCNINIVPDKINTTSFELEGTNTSGNLGIAASTTFTNRNLFNGAEQLSLKLKGAYEAITGLEGYSDQNYVELGLETRLSFPKLLSPLHTRSRGTTNLSLQFDTQERPEFHRRVLTALWSYQWENAAGNTRYKFDLPSLNYVFMPWISSTFRKDYLESDNYRSALIRYAYENLLILNTTFSRTYTSQPKELKNSKTQKPKTYRLQWAVESAGNLLYLFTNAIHSAKDNNNQRTLFDVAFAQYLKFDIDYSTTLQLNHNNAIALHAAFGIAQPYGNSDIVPFEKRYFGGGANGIRGWSVRELGPGRYMGEDGKVDFINQTGNLKLLFSTELRSHLFWKINGALFVDAGNVWTTRRYAVTGKTGQFHFHNFLEQLAASYGLGLRLNLDYFILRFDMAMKAINPAYSPSQSQYLAIIHPKFSRDFTFHFAVGLPF